VRAQQLDDREREAMETALQRIEHAGTALAAELGVDVRVERDGRGRFPLIAFRAHGFSAGSTAPAKPGRDT
jgi:hypothetical protein